MSEILQNEFVPRKDLKLALWERSERERESERAREAVIMHWCDGQDIIMSNQQQESKCQVSDNWERYHFSYHLEAIDRSEFESSPVMMQANKMTCYALMLDVSLWLDCVGTFLGKSERVREWWDLIDNCMRWKVDHLLIACLLMCHHLLSSFYHQISLSLYYFVVCFLSSDVPRCRTENRVWRFAISHLALFLTHCSHGFLFLLLCLKVMSDYRRRNREWARERRERDLFS